MRTDPVVIESQFETDTSTNERRHGFSIHDRELGAINHYRDNPAVLAEWQTARHVERGPKKKPPPPFAKG